MPRHIRINYLKGVTVPHHPAIDTPLDTAPDFLTRVVCHARPPTETASRLATSAPINRPPNLLARLMSEALQEDVQRLAALERARQQLEQARARFAAD